MGLRQPLMVEEIQLDQGSVDNRWNFANIIATVILASFLIHILFKRLDGSFFAFCNATWSLFLRIMPAPLIPGLRAASNPSASSGLGSFRTPLQNLAGSGVLRSSPYNGTEDKVTRRGKRMHMSAPQGLGNWDNSCYQNSILQALAALPIVCTFLEQVEHSTFGLPRDSTVFALRLLVQALNDLDGDSLYLWPPSKLKSMSTWQQQDAQEYYSKLIDAVESDTKAALRTQLYRSNVDLANLCPEKRRDMESVRAGTSDSVKIIQESSQVFRTNQLSNPLEGLYAQRVGCTECGYTEGLSLIPFNCMTLPLGRSHEYTIEDCLKSSMELEYIEGVECPKCSLLQAQSQIKTSLANLNNCEKPSESSPKFRDDSLKRLSSIDRALTEQDFQETTLKEECQIPGTLRKQSTKSRQVVLLRPPQCLAMHINRSLFDEYSGSQLKNHAIVRFPDILDASPWIIGNDRTAQTSGGNNKTVDEWSIDPRVSMLRPDNSTIPKGQVQYKLKALITHYGRHENGHYICYRQSPPENSPKPQSHEDNVEIDPEDLASQWWRLSDEDVTRVSEEHVLSQPGAFMLFYERTVVESEHKAETALQSTNEATSNGAPNIIKERTTTLDDIGATVSISVDEAETGVSLQETGNASDSTDETNVTGDPYPSSSGHHTTDELVDEGASAKIDQHPQLSPSTMKTALPNEYVREEHTSLTPSQVVSPI